MPRQTQSMEKGQLSQNKSLFDLCLRAWCNVINQISWPFALWSLWISWHVRQQDALPGWTCLCRTDRLSGVRGLALIIHSVRSTSQQWVSKRPFIWSRSPCVVTCRREWNASGNTACKMWFNTVLNSSTVISTCTTNVRWSAPQPPWTGPPTDSYHKEKRACLSPGF